VKEMARVFNECIFKFKIFNAFTPQERRADKIRRMNEYIRKHGYDRYKLEQLGYKDCLGEVESYSEDQSSWSSRSHKGKNEPKWMWQSGMKVGKNIPENKEIEEILGENDE